MRAFLWTMAILNAIRFLRSFYFAMSTERYPRIEDPVTVRSVDGVNALICLAFMSWAIWLIFR